MEISIIVPVYNVKPYLERCIKSIINQTFEDFELIIVDDGSTDGCSEMCDKYASTDNRVRVIHQINGGLSAARNAGLDIANGKYIVFADSDDFLKPKLLEKAHATIEKGYDLVSFCFEYCFNESPLKPFVFSGAGKEYSFYDSYDTLQYIVSVLLSHKTPWEAWDQIFRKDIIDKYHLRFAPNKEIFAEDLHFYLCYITHVKKMYVLKDYLYNYMRRNDSIIGCSLRESNLNRFTNLSKSVLEYYSFIDSSSELVNHFSAIYFMILYHAMFVYYRKASFSLDEYNILRTDISDQDFLLKNLEHIKDERNLLSLCISKPQLNDFINDIDCFISGNVISHKIRTYINYLFYWRNYND